MNKPVGFDDKLKHSIELLRKAEKLALRYDPENGFFNTFSGGKDSQAMYHVVEMAGVKHQTHMNFTSVDPPQVVRFVKTHYPDVIRHAPKWSIYTRAVQRGILPSMRIRWCCADFKEQAGAGKVTLIGIRKEESVRRSKRHEVEVSNRQFSGNLDEFAVWQEEQIKKKEEKLLRKMKCEGKKVNEDYFSADKENEVRCINGKDSILISPIFDWTEKDVWYFLNEVVKVPHCELYDKGYKRIGCILCPMSQYKQKIKEMHDFPHVKRKWIEAIKKIREGVSQDKRTNARYSQAEWNENFEKGSWNRKANSGIWAGRWIQCPDEQYWNGFSISHSLSDTYRGQNEQTEDEIAENIFDWWISGKSYSRWYADKYLQGKLNFNNE